MSNALNSTWLPDRRLMDETSDWITARPHWLLRWAPVIVAAIMILLVIVVKKIEVPIPRFLPVSILTPVENAEEGVVVFQTPMIADVPEVGMSVVARISSDDQNQVVRVDGKIIKIKPAPGILSINVKLAKNIELQGTGVLLTPSDFEPLYDVLLRKIKTRGGAL